VAKVERTQQIAIFFLLLFFGDLRTDNMNTKDLKHQVTTHTFSTGVFR
jgi:hypothetical protein